MVPAELVTSFIDTVWNQGKLDAIPRFVAPEYAVDGIAVGPDWVRANVEAFRAGFSDLAIVALRVVADGPHVAVLVQVTATHDGPWKGFAPTGRAIAYREAGFWTVDVDSERGLLVGGDFVADTLSVRVQMGIASPDLWSGPNT